jgi:hypothetical protein
MVVYPFTYRTGSFRRDDFFGRRVFSNCKLGGSSIPSQAAPTHAPRSTCCTVPVCRTPISSTTTRRAQGPQTTTFTFLILGGLSTFHFFLTVFCKRRKKTVLVYYTLFGLGIIDTAN